MANNDTCDPNGKGMNKWAQSFCWCTNKSSGTLGTANGAGYDFLTGKTVLGDEDGAAFDKRDWRPTTSRIQRAGRKAATTRARRGASTGWGRARGRGQRGRSGAPATAQARCSVGTRGRPQEIGPGTIC